MHSLPVFMRLAGRPVILLGMGDAAEAKRRLLERAGAIVSGEDAPARLAIVAIGDDAEAHAAIARLRARGILVNAVDRPGSCDFTLPAIVDRDPVLIAIGTGGASAGLAKALRQRIEAMLPAVLGSLATRLSAARAAIRERWPDAIERRRAIDAGMEPGGAIDPLGRFDVDDWLGRMTSRTTPRRETIVLRSADPDDLTLRAARLLGQADRIHHPPGLAPAILDRARADAIRIACPAAPDASEPGLTIILTLERP